jgi:hypothetical protein
VTVDPRVGVNTGMPLSSGKNDVVGDGSACGRRSKIYICCYDKYLLHNCTNFGALERERSVSIEHIVPKIPIDYCPGQARTGPTGRNTGDSVKLFCKAADPIAEYGRLNPRPLPRMVTRPVRIGALSLC